MDAHTDADPDAPTDGHPDSDPSQAHGVHLGQQDIRAAKLAARRAAGETEPYRWPVDGGRNTALADIRAAHGELAPDTVTQEQVCVAGRLMGLRRQGGLSFGTLRDRTGTIQLFVDTAVVGHDAHAAIDDLDRGDWVGVRGTVMTTRRGELSIRVDECALLAKALRPPAGGHHGLADVETRYRQRYADLEVNERTREIFRIRHAAVRAIREHLAGVGFTEVEGPVLQSIQGGASARPFVTHHNALDLDMYLRIALELHLKRLIVGGMERVFELGRVFRNEGVDTRHNPEFTMLEAYQAFADYHDMMDLTEGMVVAAARAALGSEDSDITVHYQGQEIDLRPPWPRQRFADMIADRTGAVMHPDMPIDEARRILDGLGIAWEQGWGAGRLMKEVYDERVQHDVVGPVFCIDYPREVSPLARAHREDPAYSERFELIVAGFELCNAYSEQNDPVEQMAAFEDEAQAKRNGDPEAGDIDLDYVRALEYGMPPTGGLGIGIDRLVMLLASVDSIREVILFPTLRPEFAPPPGGGPGGAHRPVLPPTGLPAAALAAATPQAPVAVPAGASASAVTPAVVTTDDEGPARRPGIVTLVAGLTALAGLLHLLVHVPIVHERLGDRVSLDLVPPWFAVTGHVLSAAIGLLLILLADQLNKRKQAAWRVAVVLSALAVVAHVLKGPHQVGLGISVLILALLLVARGHFRAPADPPSLLRLVRFVPIYLACVLAFGFVSLGLQSGRMTPELTFLGGLETIFGGLVGIDGPYTFERRGFAATFPAALLALGIVGLVVFLILLFRPLTARDPHTRDDWTRAQALVHTYGWDTLAAFALRDDKSFFFSSDGRAMIAYTYLGGYALAAGDPIGDEASLPRVVDEFLAMCSRRAWTPAFLAAREEDTREGGLLASRGFRSFYLGDEAIIDCPSFTLEGRERKSVRAAVRRVERTHHFQMIAESAASPKLVEALNAISEKWRGKNPERGFTMSLSQDITGSAANSDFLLCVALDADGVPGGFLRLVPAHGGPATGTTFGYTLDLMRHDPGAPNGMTEFLIARSATALGERGVTRLSMNFAMWGRLFAEDVPFTATQKLARRAVGVLNPFFQVRSLHDFNAKFGPQWLPRVLAYRSPADLPRVGLLYAGAEGFLAVPGLGPLFVPAAVGGAPSPSGSAATGSATDTARAA
ncbi:lysine--tRNA ligase [Actinomycetospora cinnamomea]|uniref:Lysine--tRNA ligase n=1 Tax=Actinomycetospora cinnamomea TaxID=663609 RepID=A0A2U1FBG0_9PSEU|nr:lysine--tRNA ligase [Actinomycetospora cinnamomea]PVZ09531.1 lysyl-tRNA synthetase [Actinomycetospora cinnamomea]